MIENVRSSTASPWVVSSGAVRRRHSPTGHLQVSAVPTHVVRRVESK